MSSGRGNNAPPISAVIFDFDGTLVQTHDASWQVFRKINERFELGVKSRDQFFDLFRDNVFHAIDQLCDDGERAGEVKHEFMEALRTDYLPPMVPGMADVVRELSEAVPLCVLSSNVMEVVRRILVANDIAYCFGHVFTADVESDKGSAIARFLSTSVYRSQRRGTPTYEHRDDDRREPARETIMLTDTIGDVRMARAAGARAMGVSWGMHQEQALLDAGAEFVAIWPQEILTHVLGPAVAGDATAATRGQARTSHPRSKNGAAGRTKRAATTTSNSGARNGPSSSKPTLEQDGQQLDPQPREEER